MLERIVYISAAVEEQTAASVERILEVSRSRNQAHGVTGLLIGGGHWWMQLIEGEPDRLDPVWNSIRSDPRHDPVILVQRRSVRSRSFPGWDMKFRQENDDSFDALLEELTGGIGEPRLREQIVRFSRAFLRPGIRWDGAAA